jgi:hypothetical protein
LCRKACDGAGRGRAARGEELEAFGGAAGVVCGCLPPARLTDGLPNCRTSGRTNGRTSMVELNSCILSEHTRQLVRRSVAMMFWSSRMASKAEAMRPTKMFCCEERGEREGQAGGSRVG